MRRAPQLVDTGFLVALVNRADPAHGACVDAWKSVRGPFVSVEGVLVEAAGLLRRVPGAFEAAYRLLSAVGTVWAPPSAARVETALELMRHYDDVPMDFVDAHLTALADEVRARRILTLDRRGFRAFRTPSGRALELLP